MLTPLWFHLAALSVAHGKPADDSFVALLAWIDVERWRHHDDRRFEEVVDLGGEAG